MRTDRLRICNPVLLALAAGTLIFCGACGGGGGGSGGTPSDLVPPPELSVISGDVDVSDGASGPTLAPIDEAALEVELDDRGAVAATDATGRFRIEGVANGDHTLRFRLRTGERAMLQVRVMAGKGADLGRVRIRDGRVEDFTGFNGYRFGFVDEDGDGKNDNFVDADGNGICDRDRLYEGNSYRTAMGFVDEDRDGRNDRFRDADGDGANDLDGRRYGFGFGFIDEDGDGVNDKFVDADGDGICDLSGMAYCHPFGFRDEDGDGTNDLFTDADGDGTNDLTGEQYVALPGWVDLDGDGVNDFFRDRNGDGVNDLDGELCFGHGFGWEDLDGDGVNDRFVDADGDGENDLAEGPFARFRYRYGFREGGVDADGNGIDDETGEPVEHGCGWVDADGDGKNDAFCDADGDGVNDLTGLQYTWCYQWRHEVAAGQGPPAVDWPGPRNQHGR